MTENASDTYTQAADWLMGTAKRNPEALLVLAAGAALLMRKGSKATPATVAHSYTNDVTRGPREVVSRGLSGRVSQVAEQASGYASEIKDRVSGTATSVSDYAGNVGETISNQGARLAERAQSAVSTGASELLRQQPLAVALLGVAAGAALAALLPPTEMEDRTLSSSHKVIADAANKVGGAVLDAAGEAGEVLKHSAAEHGISSEGLKEIAGEVADTFASKVTGKSEKEPQPGAN
jgi:hypothetical protein